MKAIMYHYVRPGDPTLPYFRFLRIDDFTRQLDFFEQEYGFLTKKEFIKSLVSGVPNNNGVVLTFDDGFKDHYRNVFPELIKRGIWGIFYIPTSPHVTGKLLDVHCIHMLIGKCGGKNIFDSTINMIREEMLSYSHVEEFRKGTYKNQRDDEYTKDVKRILNYYINYKHRERVINELMAIKYPEGCISVNEFYMTIDEIHQMHDAGMVVGSHTVNHLVMSKLSVENQKYEIESSFRFLEDIVESFYFKTFCYPYGGYHTFTDETERLLDQNSCLCSFNVEARDITENELAFRRQALPRYDCRMFS